MHVDFKLYRRTPKATREHFHALGTAGWSYSDICALLRACTTLKTTSELLCSVEMTESEQARVEKRSDSAEKRAKALAERHGGEFRYSGDPRGCPILVVPGSPEGMPTAPKGLPSTGWGGGYAID